MERSQRNQRPVAPGRETAEQDPELWDRYTAELGELHDTLCARFPSTIETRGRGSLGRRRARSRPGPTPSRKYPARPRRGIRRAGEVRTDLPRPGEAPEGRTGGLSAAPQCSSPAPPGGQGTAAQAAMLRQLIGLTQAVHDAAKAHQQARHAEAIATDVRDAVGAGA